MLASRARLSVQKNEREGAEQSCSSKHNLKNLKAK